MVPTQGSPDPAGQPQAAGHRVKDPGYTGCRGLHPTIRKPDLGPAFYAWTFANAYDDPEDNFRRSYRSDGSLNYFGYKNSKVDELIDKGAIILDQKRKGQDIRGTPKADLGDYTALFTAEEQWFITRRDTLRGYDFYPL